MPYEITEERREQYREASLRSRERKRLALEKKAFQPIHQVNSPFLDPNDLMPQQSGSGLYSLSLFSGGGGLDLGFERAGFRHAASYEILDVCKETLNTNRPNWEVYGGNEGDVRSVNWKKLHDGVDVIHGGPPCQPFSIAGNQKGEEDERNMWPSFVRAVLDLEPSAFVAENVPGLLDPKFSSFVSTVIEKPLSRKYSITRFCLSSEGFGVPQSRKRVFFVGFRRSVHLRKFLVPCPTHTIDDELAFGLSRCLGARQALGLGGIGFDWVAPTLRSGFTGPRNTTGVVNSKASMELWNKLQIWPNGVQANREAASLFPPENGHFRMSIQDCGILQGFPEDWQFSGAVYQVLGQIGNSVCPPVAYAVAMNVAKALKAH
jgi:DNA (cytosine-5)-methyltransferase 1